MKRSAAFAFAALLCGAVSLKAQSGSQAVVEGPLGIRVDSALRALESQGMSGTFLVRKNGATLLQKGYGLAIRNPRTPFTPDIATQIGSCTKDFTAVAILQLAQRGKFALTDKITRWFPEAPADKRAITVAQLLDHTAGFEEYSGGDFDAVTREQFSAHLMASKLRSAPGAEEHYSNPGYGLLAVIIEKMSGTSYDEYLRDAIITPLGLTHTGFLLPHFDRARVSRGYNAGGEESIIIEKAHAADGPYWNLRGNGGMLSTVAEMQTFYDALFGGETLVSFAARGQRFAPNGAVGLAGGDMTHFFLYERDPQKGTSIIIATNNAAFSGPKVRMPIEIVLGNRTAMPAGAPGGAANVPAAKLPDTPAGAAFARYMEAFNSGDTTKMLAFFTEHLAPNPQGPTTAQRIANYRRIFEHIGPITPRSVSSPDANSIAVTTRNRDGETVTIGITVEPSGAHRIVGVRITAG